MIECFSFNGKVLGATWDDKEKRTHIFIEGSSDKVAVIDTSGRPWRSLAAGDEVQFVVTKTAEVANAIGA